MVPPNSSGVSRVPLYLGAQHQPGFRLRLPGCYRLWHAFPERFSSPETDLAVSAVPRAASHDPPCTKPAGHMCTRFGLVPVRSPLLRESRLISSPRGTKMLQFPRLPSPALWIQTGIAPHYRRRVAPFGNLRVKGSLHLAGAVSLLATPFIGSQRQGIHRTPLVTYRSTVQKEEHRRNHFAIDDVGRQELQSSGVGELRRTTTVFHRSDSGTRGSGRRRHHAFAMQLSRYTSRDRRVSGFGFGVSAPPPRVDTWVHPYTHNGRSLVCPDVRNPKRETRNLRGYRLVETTGLEPVTFSVQGRRSPN